ncbi:hypothetical protein C5S39_14345, partial [Candidatus Methanophagaceae archaeon]
MPSATFDWAIKLSYLCEETTLDFRGYNNPNHYFTLRSFVITYMAVRG